MVCIDIYICYVCIYTCLCMYFYVYSFLKNSHSLLAPEAQTSKNKNTMLKKNKTKKTKKEYHALC